MAEIIKSKHKQSDFDPLPYHLPYMTEEIRKRAEVELFEDEESREHCLKQLKDMLDEEDNLHYQNEDNFLLGFLRAKKFDLKRTFALVKQFYIVKKKHDELYGNPTLEIFENTLSDNSVGFLPYRNDDGCCILILHLGYWDLECNSHGDLMRSLTAALLHAIRSPSTQIAGIKVIVDVKNFNLRKLSHISPTYLWLFTEALQNCFPARFKGIHIVNESVLFSPIWKIMRQFLSRKLADRFYFHGHRRDKLHQHFHPKVLPKEYGGEAPPYLNSEWVKIFLSDIDYILHVLSCGYMKPNKQ